MDVSKYRALFIEEGREHLAEMSRLLVELESATDRGPRIDDVFRHAHSIKGMAASMGYDPIATLAHRFEDVVGVHRQSGAPFLPATVDLLLRGVDALGQQVQSIADGTVLAGYFELVRALAQVMQQSGAGPAAATLPAALSMGEPTPETDDLAPPCVCVTLTASCPTPALRAFLVHRRLQELGEIVRLEPSMADIRSGKMTGHEVRFFFRQSYDPAAVQQVLQHIPDIDSVTFPVMDAAPVPPLTPDDALPLAAESSASQGTSTVRVRTDLLDDIMDSVGELFIARERLRVLLNEAPQDVRTEIDGLGRRIRQIHDQVIAARMIPLRTLTDRYPRLVRDLCRSLGKDAELEIAGGDIEIDRAVIENLDAPLLHTLRNAVDHGVEAPAQRTRAGKPATGRIVITATRDRDAILIVVEDDGAGLNPDTLRAVAVQRQLITQAHASALSAREAFYLICMPGFSTKSEVTPISGRGVGMDVVAARLESMGGVLDIESEAGRGTRLSFRLPQTLAIVPVLLVQAVGRVFAVPVAKVVAVRETGDDTLVQPDGSRYFSFRDRLLRIQPLTKLLALTTTHLPNQLVVVESGRELYALGVDHVVGYHEVVVKPLGDPLDRLELFSGATILGDGQPILILDLPKTLRPRMAA